MAPPDSGGKALNDIGDRIGLRHNSLARRGFVMTSLISGFTLATRVLHAQAIHTDAAGLSAGEAKVPVSGGAMPIDYARPATGTRFPVILVNEEIFGIHGYIADVCRRFAKRLSRGGAGDLLPQSGFPEIDRRRSGHARGRAEDAGRSNHGGPGRNAGLGRRQRRRSQCDGRDRLLPRREDFVVLPPTARN